jgi:hypothetical protein
MATKTFTITAPDDTMEKLEAFFSMLHYNGGHSGIFGMSFDGDGHESAKFDPEPAKFAAGGEISGVGTDAEIVTSKSACTGYMFEKDRKYVARGDEKAERMVYKEEGGWVNDDTKNQYANWVRKNCKFAQRQGPTLQDAINYARKIGLSDSDLTTLTLQEVMEGLTARENLKPSSMKEILDEVAPIPEEPLPPQQRTYIPSGNVNQDPWRGVPLDSSPSGDFAGKDHPNQPYRGRGY